MKHFNHDGIGWNQCRKSLAQFSRMSIVRHFGPSSHYTDENDPSTCTTYLESGKVIFLPQEAKTSQQKVNSDSGRNNWSLLDSEENLALCDRDENMRNKRKSSFLVFAWGRGWSSAAHAVVRVFRLLFGRLENLEGAH